MLRKITTLLFLFNVVLLNAQENEKAEINWISFEEAVTLNQTKPKKILVDIYTDWCGWCKRMDATTYSNQSIVEYINEKYYAVKLDAEMKDTVKLGEQIFVNKNPKGRRNPHDLAIQLLNGKMTYPSTVILDERVELMNPPIAGYMDARKIEPILHYFGDDVYEKKEMGWEEFQKSFEGKVK